MTAYYKQLAEELYKMLEEVSDFIDYDKVPEPIFVYIRQLEDEINYGMGGVQKLYPFRFGKKLNAEDWGANTPIVPDETMEELLKNGIKK